MTDVVIYFSAKILTSHAVNNEKQAHSVFHLRYFRLLRINKNYAINNNFFGYLLNNKLISTFAFIKFDAFKTYHGRRVALNWNYCHNNYNIVDIDVKLWFG